MYFGLLMVLMVTNLFAEDAGFILPEALNGKMTELYLVNYDVDPDESIDDFVLKDLMKQGFIN